MKTCDWCGLTYARHPREARQQYADRRFCSRACADKGRRTTRVADDKFKARYRQVSTPDGRKLLEHRWVVEQAIGRPLLPGEQVHHINHNRLDNRLENLELVTSKEHGLRHTVYPTTKTCGVCGENFMPAKAKRKRAVTCGRLPCKRATSAGQNNGMARITDSQVRELRTLRAAGATLRELAERYDMSISGISAIANGRNRAAA